MNILAIKIVGASGQGLVSIGDILAKTLKRAGYCVFGYREFMSLIKGGHGCYQIDISSDQIRSSQKTVDVVIALNHHGFEYNLGDLKQGGVLLHDTPDWKFSKDEQKLMDTKKITVICLPIPDMLKQIKGKAILANVIFSAFAWALLKGDKQLLIDTVCERFKKKPDMLESNKAAIEAGFGAASNHASIALRLPEPNAHWKDQLLLTGSEAMGLGVVHAGVRLFAGYPMTPSSPLLHYIADIQNDTGMVIKQAEDEITAAQIASGAMHMGTRAMTATSGGGFDLMTETISMNAIIENPCVIVLAQRPGPATGLPTWTAQGDLLLAIHSGHGEFSRCVLSASDSADAFSLVAEAFNIAENYQIPVILLTDKQIAEGIFTQDVYEGSVTINRGRLIVKPAELKKLKSSDRYDPATKDGISSRWLPGSNAATYCAQGDEHRGDGSVDETADNAKAQMEKRLKKMEALKKEMPEPELFGDEKAEVLLVGWGSTKGAVLDALKGTKSVSYLHYTHLWPLKTDTLKKLMAKAKKTVLIEGNATSQLGYLLKQEGIVIDDPILKYDGRPFFRDDVLEALHSHA